MTNPSIDPVAQIDWSDPLARLKLLESIGPDAYNKAMERHFAEETVEVCNGYPLRRVASRFGTLISVDGTGSAYRDLERARAVAQSLEPGSQSHAA